VKLIPETAAWHDEMGIKSRSYLSKPIPSNNCENFLSLRPMNRPSVLYSTILTFMYCTSEHRERAAQIESPLHTTGRAFHMHCCPAFCSAMNGKMWHCEVLSWCCVAECRVVRRYREFWQGKPCIRHRFKHRLDPGNVTYRMARATEFLVLVAVAVDEWERMHGREDT
jgi:hypothetical protein